MQKVVLSKINLIYGFVETPKGFEIDRKKIKNDILHSYVNEERVSDNNLDYLYHNSVEQLSDIKGLPTALQMGEFNITDVLTAPYIFT